MSVAFIPQRNARPGSQVGKRELQKAVHRQAILEAGEHVLGADLRECVAVDKIAARAGLAKGTVYNYFVDKTALVEAVTQRVEARVVERIGRAMSGRPSAGARLVAAICCMFETAAQFPQEAVILERRGGGGAGSRHSLIGALILAELKSEEFDHLAEAGARRAAMILILSAIFSGMREVACGRIRWGEAEILALIRRCLAALEMGKDEASRALSAGAGFAFADGGVAGRLEEGAAARECDASPAP